MKQVMTLGRLVSLKVLDPATQRTRTITGRGRWLATSSSGRDLLICTVRGASDSKPSKVVAARHRRFHREAPKGMWRGEHPTPVGPLRQIGLLQALTYAVPPGKIRSPEKNPYHWHHAFGDTGHRGGSYPEKVMPALFEDRKGNLFIRRRKGNIFKTTDWIRG